VGVTGAGNRKSRALAMLMVYGFCNGAAQEKKKARRRRALGQKPCRL